MAKMLRFVLVSLACSWLVSALAESPEFTLQPRDTTALRGDRVTLYCAVTGQESSQSFTWLKDGDVLTRGFEVLAAEPHRFSLDLSERGAHNLVIEESRPDDSGAYHCVVFVGGSGLISGTARLDVYGPPAAELPACAGPDSDQVGLGERVSIVCEVEGGNPRTELSITKAGRDVETTTTPNGIRYDWVVSESDDGVGFACTGSHRFWAEQRSCSLGPYRVVSAPPTLSLAPASATVQSGGSVSFLCTAQSAPRAAYRWLVAGQEVLEAVGGSAHRTVQSIGESSVLLLTDVGQGEMTHQIECSVESVTGRADARSVLHVEPVYSRATVDTPVAPQRTPQPDEEDDTPSAGGTPSGSPGHEGDDAGNGTENDDDSVTEAESSASLPFVVGGAAAGLLVVVVLVLVIVVAVRRQSGTSASSRSTEKLSAAVPDDEDVYYKSSLVGVARSWLFPVHKDTQKGMAASMSSEPPPPPRS